MSEKILFVCFMLMMMLPLNVDALDCDYAEQARLRKLATNITTSYTYEENGDNVVFTVTLTNMNSDLYIVDSTTGNRYDYNGNSEISIGGYTSGANIRYTIYTSKSNCVDTYLNIKYLNLPSYNKYYKDPLCEGLSDFSVCSKWQTINYSYEDFTKKVNEYKKSISSSDSASEENESTGNSITDKIFDFILNYYIYIAIGVSTLIVLIMFIKNKKNKSLDF